MNLLKVKSREGYIYYVKESDMELDTPWIDVYNSKGDQILNHVDHAIEELLWFNMDTGYGLIRRTDIFLHFDEVLEAV